MSAKTELPKKYFRPKLMVLGDSLAQGCRSLSVTAPFCAQSYSARIARAQGWNFQPPRHPQPVLGNVEDFIRQAAYFSVLSKIDKNIQAWESSFSKPPQGTLKCWDNLAISGCSIESFRDYTGKTWRQEYAAALQHYRSAKGLIGRLKAAVALHLPINGSYTLNPTGDGVFDGLTQVEWAFLRKPENLILHFGHNDGLYSVGSGGKPTDLLASKQAYLDVIEMVLKGPKEIQHIVLALLPKVSCVANLNPEGDLLPNSSYFESYHTEFPFRSAAISGEDLREMDRQIKELNGAVRMLASKAMDKRRVTIVDTYQILDRLDYKNTGNKSARIRIKGKTVDNRYIEGRLIPKSPKSKSKVKRYSFKHGGFQSLDGMHPSAVGYAIFADQMAIQMGLPRLPSSVMEQALNDERLIRYYPSTFPGFRRTLDILGAFFSGEQGEDEGKVSKPKATAAFVAGVSEQFVRQKSD